MREAIGSTFIYNIIIVFIVITVAFLVATLSYMKAFKVNGTIAKSIERFEGYNSLSVKDIENSMDTLGYHQNVKNESCPIHKHKGVVYTPITEFQTNYRYCIYEYPVENGYFIYGILTYIKMDIPIAGGAFSLPVYSETERIYQFSQR